MLINSFFIDFGTTNTGIGYLKNGKVVQHVFDNGKTTMPSAVFFEGGKRAYHYGHAAMQAYLSGVRGRLMTSMKRALGKNEHSTIIGNKAVRFSSLIEGLLKSGFDSVITSVGEENVQLQKVLCGMPVVYGTQEYSKAKQELEFVLRNVGFEQVEFLPEPVGALYSTYAHSNNKGNIEKEPKLVMVCDIGGGTTDFTLANVQLSSEGASHLANIDVIDSFGVYEGGDSINASLLWNVVAEHLGKNAEYETMPGQFIKVASDSYTYLKYQYTLHQLGLAKNILLLNKQFPWIKDTKEKNRFARMKQIASNISLGGKIHFEVEEGKKALSKRNSAHLFVDGFQDIDGSPNPLSFDISSSELCANLEPIWDKIHQGAQDMLSKNGMTVDSIDEVALVGGTTKIPYIHKQIRSLFSHSAIKNGKIFDAIVHGLGIYAKDVLKR